MVELEYPIKSGEWSISITGQYDPADRTFDDAECYLVCGEGGKLRYAIDQEVAERILALDRGWSIHVAEEQVIADAELEYEPPLCGDCNGSGEGMYDGSRCRGCRGSGVERLERYDAA